VTLSCILRWVLDGVRLKSGQKVRLEAVRLGGRWITSMEALQRFAIAQTPEPEDLARSFPFTHSARQRASARVAAELKKVGI
jgi:hypothetical protein